MSTAISTKFGSAKINNEGYYQIKSRKEGNNGKLLHRLIFEDFYNIKLDEEFPEGIVIHHLNEDKLCNEIWNLVPMTLKEHLSLHNKGIKNSMYGKHHTKNAKKKMSEKLTGRKASEETKKRMSLAKSGKNNPMYGKPPSDEHKRKIAEVLIHQRNTTGYYHVSKCKRKNVEQGFAWVYHYRDENGKMKFIQSINLKKLKERVLNKNLNWEIIDEEKAKESGLV